MTGEAKFSKMHELAMEVYDSLSEAIEEVEKDLTYNARKFLGIELWPESIVTMLAALGTIAVSLQELSF